ncbi:MAG: DUF4440 domain-containing protein [Opitutaceae bacterium]
MIPRVLLVLFALAPLHAAEDPLTALRAADDARVTATLAADRDQLSALFSDDLRYAHSTGAVDTKQSLIETLASGRTQYLSIVYDERSFDLTAPGLALMTGRARIKAKTKDGIVDSLLSFLAIWRKEQGHWRFRAWQSNKLAVHSLLPANWNPKAAGDQVLSRLIKVSAPHVKGAHDADLVLVNDRAYVVEHDNDLKAGHGAREAQYCVLSLVNLKTLAVEHVIPFARSGQAFANTTLPVGACFVPRILQLNATTLRCYFVCEDQSGKGTAQMWSRDFDLPSLTFADSIHPVKLKTPTGTFDLTAQFFHTAAAAQGFKQKPAGYGVYLIDSFKTFEGRTYAVINNFPGAQNALAVLNSAADTLELLGHYNDPAELRLTESAVNRLPDGTWLAICRAESGDRNYVFTTSPDGRVWTPAAPRTFVTKGSNSKPTFDYFNGVYYLGWQEASRIQDGRGVGRKIFNIEISRDGMTWERKYRFETEDSFQYPTFRQHAGAVWFTVTQGTRDSSDRIMFGKLETLSNRE